MKMKKISLLILVLTFLLLSSILAFGQTSEDVMWQEAARNNTKLAVESYLSEYPYGKYAATARLKLKVIEAEEQKKAQEAQFLTQARESDEKVRKFKTRHTGTVFSVSFSPDGKTLASASHDQRIKLWNVASGKELNTLAGHSSTGSSIAFSPDGKTLVSVSMDETVKLWDVAKGKKLKTFKIKPLDAISIAFSRDGKTVAFGSNDGTVKLWDVASGKVLKTFAGHTNPVYSIKFSLDGKTLASGSLGSDDKTIKLWDVASGKEMKTITANSDSTGALEFSPDGKTVAFGSNDNTVRLWDVASGNELKIFSGHSESVDLLAFSSDGKTLVSGNNEPFDKSSGNWNVTVKLWDIASGKELKTLSYTSAAVGSLALSPNGKTLILGSEDGTIKSWNTSAQPVQTPQTAQTVAGKWKLEAMLVESDMAYPITAPVTLILSASGEVSGNGGCHDFVGKYSFKQPEGPFTTPQQISFSEIKPLDRGAAKDCQRESITEQAFFSSLKSAATVVFEDGQLVIQNKPTFINTEKRKIVIQNTMAFVRDKP